MKKDRLVTILKKLGFFYIAFSSETGLVKVSAGHIENSLFAILEWNDETGSLTGSYSALITSIDLALDEFESRADEMTLLPFEERTNWISEIAKKNNLPVSSFRQLTSRIFS